MAIKTLLEYVIEQGNNETNARKIIQSGKVMVNNEEVIVPSIKIKDTDVVTIKESKKWVSRGAEKLLAAIERFNIKLENKVVLDIGSSTGGFTQVALAEGAARVIAVDVGTNQLDYKLRSHPKVEVWEKTNVKDLKESMFNIRVEYVVTDVSFISLWHVFDVLKNFTSNFDVMALIKPQYEAEVSQVSEGGYVDPKYHEEIITKVTKQAAELGFYLTDISPSPITGSKSKNIEYLTIFKRR